MGYTHADIQPLCSISRAIHRSSGATKKPQVKSFLGFAHRVGFTRFNAAPLIKPKKASARAYPLSCRWQSALAPQLLGGRSWQSLGPPPEAKPTLLVAMTRIASSQHSHVKEYG